MCALAWCVEQMWTDINVGVLRYKLKHKLINISYLIIREIAHFLLVVVLTTVSSPCDDSDTCTQAV